MASGVFFLLFVLSFTGYVGTRVVTQDLLNSRSYTRALEKNQIYDRVYTDLLADPALEDVTVSLLGDLDISSGSSRAAYSYSVSTLRIVLPPDMLQRAVERLISELTAYLSGKRSRLSANLDLSRIIFDPRFEDRILAAVQTIQTRRIAETRFRSLLPFGAREEEVIDSRTLYAQLDHYMAALAGGRLENLPAALLTMQTSRLSPANRAEITRILLAPVSSTVTEATRAQVETALANDNVPEAIEIASRELFALRAEEAVANIRQELYDGKLRSAGALARLSNQTTNDVVGELNDVRDLVGFFRQGLTPVLAVGMGLSLACLMILHSRRVSRALRIAGATLLLAGLTVLVVWGVAGQVLNMPYQNFAAETAARSFPVSLRQMLDDVLVSLTREVRYAVFARVAVVFIVGLGFIGVSLVHGTVRQLGRVLQPLEHHHRLALAGLAFVVVFSPAWLDRVIGQWRTAPPPRLKCNGHAALCDRPYNEVVYAATHNAMSISGYGWIWPQQDGTFTDQLKAGVRAMLIDTHYGDTPEKISAYLDYFPPTTRAVIARIVEGADPAFKGDGMFLCHNLCSMGGTPLVDGLTEIRIYLDKHPYEVVTLIIQDAVTPLDTARAFEQSGLIKYVYTPDLEAGWPTLREMIAYDTRLVVLAERGSPPPAWYLHAWEYLEETPYSFHSAQEFECVPNRGGEGRPLFLLNHWISHQSPSRVDAVLVNSYSVLFERARSCAEGRGQNPNFVAVDFYSIGDLFDVVATLNGLRAPR